MTSALGRESVDALGEAIADRLAEVWGLRRVTEDVVDASTLAARLGVSAQWVRDHADELGGWRLGSGPKAPYRFHASGAERALRGATRQPEAKPVESSRSRRRTSSRSRLLPVRGDDPT